MGWDQRSLTALSSATTVCVGLIWYFHDRFWWPVDEGIYAYVAQRLNAGDVLHRDLIDLHAGYVNILHAFAFRMFGEDLVSLRYVLAGLTLLQACLAALLLWPKGIWWAALSAVVITAFSFIQFLNPSANWYALFICLTTVWTLTRVDSGRASDVIQVGFLIGLCFLFRQLSGVFLAMGAMTWLLLRAEPNGIGRCYLGRGIVILMALGLSGYLWSKASIVGFLLFGVWPLALLAMSLRDLQVGDATVAKLVLRLSIGAILAALPLVIYHILEGSLGDWIDDIFFTAFLIHEQPFIAQVSFGHLAIGGLLGLTAWREPAVVLNGLFWLALCAVPVLLGCRLLRDRLRRDHAALLHPLPVMAVFFGLVALHYQIPIYLFFAIGPILLACVMMIDGIRKQLVMAVAMASLCLIAIVFHAGQPLSRGLAGIVRGERIALDAGEGLARARLKMERADQQVYRRLIDYIDSEAKPGEPLFALPMDPELNFLTQRPAPVRFYATPLGLRQDRDVVETMERLEKAAPLFVVHRRGDKYMTPLSDVLLAQIRRLDPSPRSFGPFDLYRLPDRSDRNEIPPDRE